MSATPVPLPAVPPPPVVYAVTTSPRSQDLVEYERFRLWWAPGAKGAFVIRLLLASGVSAILIAGLALSNHQPVGSIPLIFGAAVAVASVIRFGWKFLTVPFRMKAMTRENPGLMRSATYNITDQGLTRETEGQLEVLPWAEFKGLVEGDGLIYLMHPSHALILPRRDFASPAASQQFLAQCRARVEAARPIG